MSIWCSPGYTAGYTHTSQIRIPLYPMAFTHSLEVLYALLRLYASGLSGTSLCYQGLPYPHLQQRLQQTLRAVALTAAAAVICPLLTLCLLPVLSPLEFPGFAAFLLVIIFLWTATVAQLTLRYALLPTPRRADTEPIAATSGRFQTAVCGVVDTVTRVREQPQLPVLLALCVVHTWLWKTVLYYGMTPGSAVDEVETDFEVFTFAGGVVAFVSFVLVEKSLGEDPFVLDPRVAFQGALQRDAVRAVRRGVLVYVLGRVLGFCFGSSSENIVETGSFFTVHVARMAFQITSSVLENLAVLSSTSVFRILLFRASYSVVSEAFGDSSNLWDTLASSKPKEGDVMGALFAAEVSANTQASTPLNEQYVENLRKRMESALKQIRDKKVPNAPADAEDVEILDSLFKFENVLIGCKFDTAARESLFASRERWQGLFNSTSAVVDGFTLLLSLLNSLPDRKGATGDNSANGALALEQSVSSLLRFLSAQHDAHPLLLLHQYPHLANLRIAATSVKSPIRFFVESKLQFAIRRFLTEEARRRVFQRAKVVRAATSLLCHLVSVSRAEDKQGIVQHTVPAVLSSLMECRNALEAYMETCLKESSTTDVYVQEATALAKGIDNGIYRITEVFQGELSLFTLPPGVKTALLAYASFDA
ncbi:hypothetical protein BBJ29_000765 [Phytophthora kernoviae]|uniref:Nucleoporin protein Ndc1-Nup n=1 Tax=Phytophthora kernoviae TaxID=325452 RepID=A0A421FVN7_9STRA|nr:hypothetical protein BBJ29_000765 [Phytophthora kernoviae]